MPHRGTVFGCGARRRTAFDLLARLILCGWTHEIRLLGADSCANHTDDDCRTEQAKNLFPRQGEKFFWLKIECDEIVNIALCGLQRRRDPCPLGLGVRNVFEFETL